MGLRWWGGFYSSGTRAHTHIYTEIGKERRIFVFVGSIWSRKAEKKEKKRREEEEEREKCVTSSIYLPICLPTYLSTYLPTYLPTCLQDIQVYMPTCPPPYLPTYLLTYLPTRPPIHLAPSTHRNNAFPAWIQTQLGKRLVSKGKRREERKKSLEKGKK